MQTIFGVWFTRLPQKLCMLKCMCWNRVALFLLFNVAGCYCIQVNLTFDSTRQVLSKAYMEKVLKVISLRFRCKPSLLSQNSPKPCPNNHFCVYNQAWLCCVLCYVTQREFFSLDYIVLLCAHDVCYLLPIKRCNGSTHFTEHLLGLPYLHCWKYCALT